MLLKPVITQGDVAVCSGSVVDPAMSDAVLRINLSAGETKDVWFGVNLTGKLTIGIRTQDGINAADFWWITWGVGSVKNLGAFSNVQTIEIPISLFKGVISAKLRARAAQSPTVVVVSEDAGLLVSTLASISFP